MLGKRVQGLKLCAGVACFQIELDKASTFGVTRRSPRAALSTVSRAGPDSWRRRCVVDERGGRAAQPLHFSGQRGLLTEDLLVRIAHDGQLLFQLATSALSRLTASILASVGRERRELLQRLPLFVDLARRCAVCVARVSASSRLSSKVDRRLSSASMLAVAPPNASMRVVKSSSRSVSEDDAAVCRVQPHFEPEWQWNSH